MELLYPLNQIPIAILEKCISSWTFRSLTKRPLNIFCKNLSHFIIILNKLKIRLLDGAFKIHHQFPSGVYFYHKIHYNIGNSEEKEKFSKFAEFPVDGCDNVIKLSI
ncbi:MAG: hypothetical protein GF311_18755 [Candidatus Lokiarchaeota archaeon]|nr:hypothetical protein [Candidatus Lokiarchaeota archaeon]